MADDNGKNGTNEIGSIEVYFAKKLANNDKKVRDRAVKRMKIWLSSRNGDSFSEVEMMKLWKGLFYCMWFSDKPLVQEDLANSLAGLIHGFKDVLAVRKFTDGFFQTMGREWHGIDALRLDKFYMLIRKFLQNIFQYLKNTDWSQDALEYLSGSLTNCPCSLKNEKFANGVKVFITEIFLDELINSCMKDAPSEEVISSVIDPFLPLCAQIDDILVFKAIEENILKKLLPGSSNKIEALNVNCMKLADRIFEEAGRKRVPTKRRKVLFKYMNLFREASKTQEKAEKIVDGTESTEADKENNKKEKREKAKKRKGTNKDKNDKLSKKKSKSEDEKDGVSDKKNVEGEAAEEMSSQICMNSEESQPDPVAVKLNFETSFALEKDIAKVNKTKKKKSKKLNKQVESTLKEDSSNKEDSEVKQRKRKSKDGLSIEVVNKQAKEDEQQSGLEDSKSCDNGAASLFPNAVDERLENAVLKESGSGTAKKSCDVVAVETAKAVVQERGNKKTEASREDTDGGPKKGKATDTQEASKGKEVEVHVNDKIGDNVSGEAAVMQEAETLKEDSNTQNKVTTEVDSKSMASSNDGLENALSPKKPPRRKSLARKVKKRRSSREYVSESPSQENEAAKPNSLAIKSTVDNSTLAMQARRKTPARKAKSSEESGNTNSSKKKVIFELSKNAVTSISNLKISPAAVFTPDQKPKKGVLKESTGKRRRASDFF